MSMLANKGGRQGVTFDPCLVPCQTIPPVGSNYCTERPLFKRAARLFQSHPDLNSTELFIEHGETHKRIICIICKHICKRIHSPFKESLCCLHDALVIGMFK